MIFHRKRKAKGCKGNQTIADQCWQYGGQAVNCRLSEVYFLYQQSFQVWVEHKKIISLFSILWPFKYRQEMNHRSLQSLEYANYSLISNWGKNEASGRCQEKEDWTCHNYNSLPWIAREVSSWPWYVRSSKSVVEATAQDERRKPERCPTYRTSGLCSCSAHDDDDVNAINAKRKRELVPPDILESMNVERKINNNMEVNITQSKRWNDENGRVSIPLHCKRKVLSVSLSHEWHNSTDQDI